MTLSGQLARVQVDDLGPAIGDALDCVAAATQVEDCRFIEFNEAGAVRRTHVPSRRGRPMTVSFQAQERL